MSNALVAHLAKEIAEIIVRIEGLQKDCMAVDDSERALALHLAADHLLAALDPEASRNDYFPISDVRRLVN